MSWFPLALAVGAVIAGYCFIRSLVSLGSALHLLVIVVTFGGIVATNLGSGGYAIPFRDICIVLPLYIGVVATQGGRQALAAIPIDILLSIVFFVLVIMVCVFNPEPAAPLQVILGIKIWLFYIPCLAVGIMIAQRPDLLVGLLRQILFWGMIACVVGLVQSALVRIMGYEPAIHLFFGRYAGRVTQGFTQFEEAGGIYRIPATFSFVGQYSGFLCLYLTVAAIVTRSDPDHRVRWFAGVAIFVALVAGVLSGSRVLILILPAMIALYALCGVLSWRLLLLAPVGIVVALAALTLATVDPLEYFSASRTLAVEDANGFVLDEISDGLDNGLLGEGIGSSTIGARYSIGGVASEDTSQTYYEVYFAKAAAELGWIGFAAIVALLGVIALRVAATVWGSLGRRENAIIAPIGIYVAYMLALSFKGPVLDVDPGNIFFWLLLGVLVGTDRLRRVLDVHEMDGDLGHAPVGYDPA